MPTTATGTVVRLLGDVTIVVPSGQVPVTRRQDQRVLALLALHSGRVVAMDELIDACWEAEAPPSARRSLHNAVRRLRQSMGDDGGALCTESDGYRLAGLVRVDIVESDHALTEAAQLLAGGHWARAGTIYQEFLERWEEPFAFAGEHPYWNAVKARWIERRGGALEDLLVALLRSGTAPPLERLEVFVRQTPPNEQLIALWALTLHQARRGAAAQREFTTFRRSLEERGLVISPALQLFEKHLVEAGPGDAVALLDELMKPMEGSADTEAFVGRQDELRLLGQLVTRARTRSQVVSISGSSGIGKSTLVAQFLAGDEAQTCLVLQGRARPDRASPYGPLIEAIQPVFNDANTDILRAHVALHGGELTRLVGADKWPIDDVPAHASFGDPSPEALHDAVASLLELLVVRRPLVLVIEDVHWLLPSLVELLRYLMSRRVSTGLLLVVTCRPDAGVDLTFDRSVEHTAVTLEALHDDEVRELLRRVALPADLADRVISLSGGQPLLLRQFLNEGAAIGAIEASDGSPMRALVHRRVGALSTQARDMAQVLAMAHEVDFDDLADILGPDRVRLLPSAMDELVAAGLVTGTAGIYRFAHDELRVAVLDEVPRVRRAFLHHLIATALRRRPDVSPALVAHHLVGASDQGFGEGDAASWLRRAAEQAESALAFSEAETYYRECLALAEVTGLDEPERLAVEIALGTMLGRLDRWEEAENILVPVWDRCVEAGFKRQAAQAALGLSGDTLLGRDRFDVRPREMVESALTLLPLEDHDLRAALHLRLAFLATARGAEDVVARHVHQAMADAELTRDPAVLGATLGGLLALEGPHLDPFGHRERARRIIETGRLIGHAPLTVTGLIHDATTTLMGGADPGLERFGRVVNLLVREYREPFARPALSLLAYLKGDLAGAEAAIREQLAEIALRPGSTDLRMGVFSQLVAVMRIQDRLHEVSITPDLRASGQQTGVARLGIARALAEMGEREQAAVLARELIDDLPALLSRMPAGALVLLGEAAEMVVAVGDPQLVAPVASLLAPYDKLNCSAWIHVFGGSVSFHLGQLAVLAGDFRAGRRWLTHALDRHEQMRVMPFVARSHVAVGALELAAPDGSEVRARRALEVAIALGRASGFAAPVREAEHALRSIGSAP